MQTEIAEKAVNGVDRVVGLKIEGEARRKRPTDLAAYDLVALSWSLRLGSQADMQQALAHADEAIARDPSFARAYVAKAWAVWQTGRFDGKYPEKVCRDGAVGPHRHSARPI